MGKARIKEIPLDFEALKLIDNGRVWLLLRQHLARASQDCLNRPGDGKEREVMMNFKLKPLPGADGEAEAATVKIEVKSKVPTHRSRAFEMRLGRDGLSFNQDFPDDLDEPSLFAGDDEADNKTHS